MEQNQANNPATGMVKASIGTGKNKIEFELTQDQAAKVKRLQRHFKLQREEKALAEKENRAPRAVKY
ncbi:hypothetical protein [Bacteroides fluxus]|uniref:hypothetical protein n=1 Tax=Bacteroides fluxus TaxID=626930 RepID=UPI0023A7E054|nr:hypothetical protein [Bacteroides fluxus]